YSRRNSASRRSIMRVAYDFAPLGLPLPRLPCCIPGLSTLSFCLRVCMMLGWSTICLPFGRVWADFTLSARRGEVLCAGLVHLYTPYLSVCLAVVPVVTGDRDGMYSDACFGQERQV